MILVTLQELGSTGLCNADRMFTFRWRQPAGDLLQHLSGQAGLPSRSVLSYQSPCRGLHQETAGKRPKVSCCHAAFDVIIERKQTGCFFEKKETQTSCCLENKAKQNKSKKKPTPVYCLEQIKQAVTLKKWANMLP